MGETAEARDAPVGLPGGRPNQFALPRGPLGWLAGRLMSRGNDITNRDVASRLDIAPGERVLEVGYGPGGLLRLLLEQTPAALVAGVDPSQVMYRQARRANRAHLGSGAGSGARRLDLRVGSVERLPFPDASFDHAVGVNTVAVWPDLEAGLRELHRVLRPGGRLLLGWHGRHSPNRMQRRLGLSEQRIAEIQQAITRVFGPTDRADLTHLVTWQARRQ